MAFSEILKKKVCKELDYRKFKVKMHFEKGSLLGYTNGHTLKMEYHNNTDIARVMLYVNKRKPLNIAADKYIKKKNYRYSSNSKAVWYDLKVDVMYQEQAISKLIITLNNLLNIADIIDNKKIFPKPPPKPKKEPEQKTPPPPPTPKKEKVTPKVEKPKQRKNMETVKTFKISRILVKELNQFKGFEIDLTYPVGHEKAGQPLDKVCFIGQNGTGKTSLISIIRAFIEQNADSEILQNNTTSIEIDYTDFENKQHTHTFYLNKFNGVKPEQTLIHFPADMLSIPKAQDKPIPTSGIIDFNTLSAQKTWELIKDEIIAYNKNEKNERDKIVKNALSATAEELVELTSNFNQWKINNPSPVKQLADLCLDRFFEKFNLKVKTKINFEKDDEINYIKIENLQGEELGELERILSSGTKQVLHTAMPLYTLKPENSIVIFDEPERSLYPDIQKEIVDFYTKLSPKSQFFFATHSPIIASAFEPWEVIEIRYNPENGKVKQELWYSGKREQDNYFKDPRYLSWDDILMKIYGLREDGNPERIEMLMEVASLKRKLEKNDLPQEEKQELFKKFKKLAQLVNFKFRKTDEKDR